MSRLSVQKTKDGSSTLLHEEMDETYHSRNGAWEEAQHVFIKQGLDFFIQRAHRNAQEIHTPIRVFEMGFGTGLNAWQTALWAKKNKVPIHYSSLEIRPLEGGIIDALNFKTFVSMQEDQVLFDKIHESNWGYLEYVHDFFALKKIEGDLLTWDKTRSESDFDLCFFDAFAPNKQESLWTESALKNITERLKKEAMLTTYCAQGQFRRNLQNLKMTVERIDGPPGKKHMTRAFKL